MAVRNDRPLFLKKDKIMEKTIQIGGKDVRLNNNITWTLVYREQFNKDIVQTLMPALAALMDVVSGLVGEVGKELTVDEILEKLDGDHLIDAVAHIGGLEFGDLLDITWALAKTADDKVPDPVTWARQFDTFYIDEVAPEVFKLIVAGVVSSKNLTRLKSLKKTIQPKKKISN